MQTGRGDLQQTESWRIKISKKNINEIIERWAKYKEQAIHSGGNLTDQWHTSN